MESCFTSYFGEFQKVEVYSVEFSDTEHDVGQQMYEEHIHASETDGTQ